MCEKQNVGPVMKVSGETRQNEIILFLGYNVFEKS